MQNGRWADTEDLVLFDYANRTGTVEGQAFELGDRTTVRLTCAVYGLEQGASVTVTVETREAPTAPWRPLGTFPARNAIGSERRSFGGADRFVRAVAVVEGGSALFQVRGEVA
jgi:hypothetical protein